MTTLLRAIIAVAAILPSASAIADDPFMTIHLQNQKVGSAVHAYWQGVATAGVPSVDEYMSIHRDNQKIGSAVVAFWQAYAAVAAQDVQMAIHMDNQTFNSAVVSLWRSHMNPGQEPGDVAEQR
jgi:hypothetical protein